MKRLFFFFILFILLQEYCEAQLSASWKKKRQEFFFGSGATNFLGDLGGANQVGTNGLKDFDFPAVRPSFVMGYRYRASKETAIKANLIYGIIAGDDKYTTEPFRNNRNCNFRSPVVELSTEFQYAIVRERPGHIYNLKGVRGWRYIQISTYIFGGAGIIYFDPRGQWDKNWMRLKPLSTEGQGIIATRKKYTSVQFVLPLGIGFKYVLDKDWSVGIEYGIRKTFTDYIDDVSKTYFDPNTLRDKKGMGAVYFADPSLGLIPGQTAPGNQRGDPTDKDSYMFGFICFYYKIKEGSLSLPKFR